LQLVRQAASPPLLRVISEHQSKHYPWAVVFPIGTLVDATNYRPLPFARRTPAVIGDVQAADAATHHGDVEARKVHDGVPMMKRLSP